jgi:hypothetical protein
MSIQNYFSYLPQKVPILKPSKEHETQEGEVP